MRCPLNRPPQGAGEVVLEVPLFLNQPTLGSVEVRKEFLLSKLKDLQQQGLQDQLHVGGRLRHFVQNWETLIKDPWVLDLIHNGLELELSSEPGPNPVEEFPISDKDFHILMEEVTEMESKGAVEECFDQEGIYSPMFVVPKKNKKLRPVWDRRFINSHHIKHHFKMESLLTVKELLQRGDYMTVIDLKDAYFHIPIAEKHWNYFRFRLRGRSWRYLVMMFGLTSAPRIWTKLMRTVVAVIRLNGHSNSDIHRRYSDHEQVIRRVPPTHSGDLGVVGKVGNQSQLGKVQINAQSNTRVFRINNRLIQHDFQDTQRQIKKHQEGGKRSIGQSTNHSTDVSTSIRQVDGSGIGSLSNQVENVGFDQVQKQPNVSWLRQSNTVISGGNRRATMVAKQSQQMEWKNSVNGSSNNSTPNRCIQNGLGSCVGTNRTGNSRFLVTFRNNLQQQCKRIVSRHIWGKVFRRVSFRGSGRVVNGQHNCSQLHQQNGRESTNSAQHSTRVLELVPGTSSQCKSTISSRTEKSNSRSSFQTSSGQIRLDAQPSHLSKVGSQVGSTRYRSVCFKVKSPTSKILLLETRSKSISSGCFQSKLETSPLLGKSPIQFNRSSVEQSSERKSGDNISNTTLANTILVPSTSRSNGRLSNSLTRSSRSISTRFLRQRSGIRKSQLESSRLAYLRQRGIYQELSEEAVAFVLSRGKPTTGKTYDHGWRVFAEWWNSHNFLQDNISPARVAQFLYDKFTAGYSFSAIASFRTAVSVTAPTWLGLPLGQTDVVKTMMHKIELENPPEPRYEATWDMNILVHYIASLPDNKDLDTDVLRRKCIVLFKLVTMARSADVDSVKFATLAFTPQHMVYQLRPTKNYKRTTQEIHKVLRLEDTNKLCPVACWEEYIQRTSQIRRAADKVFVAVKSPYKEISRDTIAKDTMLMMEAAGVDTTRFKSHSTRSAAASKALDQGASVDEVMKQGRWRSRSVFTRFYDRSQRKDNFSQLVLLGSSN